MRRRDINLDLRKITFYPWLLENQSYPKESLKLELNTIKLTQYTFTLCVLKSRCQGHPGQKWSPSSDLGEKKMKQIAIEEKPIAPV